MDDTATPLAGPVDAPASLESITAEFEAGGESPVDALEDITQELVNEAEGTGDAEQAPATEDDATEATEEAEQPEESSPDDQKFTVKVNGEDHEVPLTELLKGYSRTEDYKAKTMAVAEERRALEAERSQVEARVTADYASKLEEATNLFAQYDPILAEARTIDWNALKAADPAAYLQAQDAVQARLNAIRQMNEQVEQRRGEAQQRQQALTAEEREQRFDKAANKIVEAMPELADEAKFQSFVTDSIGFLRAEGFHDAELADVMDDRVLRLADKARRWDAHEAAQKALPDKKVIQTSSVKPLTTDGSSSRANPPRFPGKSSRDARVDWVAQQILSED